MTTFRPGTTSGRDLAAFAGGFLLILAASATAQPLASGSPQPASSAEARACAECHEETVQRFASQPHGRAFAFDARHGNASCASCHGDGARHIETGEPGDIVALRRVGSREVERTCLSCHKGHSQSAAWAGSTHQRRGVACVDCHSIHAEAPPTLELAAARQNESCYRCHANVRAEMRKVSHHPVREGKMSCLSCHEPHGSTTKGSLRASSVNELCYDCHTEKRGPFLWEHAPVRENCTTCHSPHGSNHLKLQKTSVPFLCQQCHLNTRHPGTLYDATTLAGAARASNRIFNRACLDCHAAVHGSNHPSSPYLGH